MSSKKVQHNPIISADPDLQHQVTALSSKIDSMESRMEEWETNLDQKIDSKFDLILQKLDNQSGNRNFKRRGSGRGLL